MDPLTQPADSDLSIFAVGSMLLRARWKILGAVALAGGVGALSAIMASDRYVASASFLPADSEAGAGGVAGLAGQLGFALPGARQGPFYIELLRSRELLEPTARDTFFVGSRRSTLATLYDIRGPTPRHVEERVVQRLATIVDADESRTGIVHVTVTTPWPELSRQIADRLLARLNEFNVSTRQTQARTERRQVEERLKETQTRLREAEERLKTFLQGNRQYTTSPQLVFEHDRLQRETSLLQSLLTSLSVSYEEARSREVRDTPVFTVIERPRTPLVPESSRWWLKGILGGLIGAFFAVFGVILSHAVRRRRDAGDRDALEFLDGLRSLRTRRPAGLRRDPITARISE